MQSVREASIPIPDVPVAVSQPMIKVNMDLEPVPAGQPSTVAMTFDEIRAVGAGYNYNQGSGQ